MQRATDMSASHERAAGKQSVKTCLDVEFGGYSACGIKTRNDDAFAAHIPASLHAKTMKGAVACIADGISVSDRSHIASQMSVTQFIDDYYATPESWSVEESASRVLRSLNDWLSAQSRHNQTSAMVTTFSGVIVKSKSLHIFHAGDSRVYRLRGTELRQLTRDHCMNFTGNDSVLTQALGMDARLSVDYSQKDAQVGDVLLLTTDGVTESLSLAELKAELAAINMSGGSLDDIAEKICQAAINAGSRDNVSCGLIRIEALPVENLNEAHRRVTAQKIPPVMQPGNKIDEYSVLSVLHSGTRSHVYKVRSVANGETYVLKAPSANFTQDAVYLDGFIREQWAGRRLKHPGLMRVHPASEDSPFLYLLCEHIGGQSLRAWMQDNPRPALSKVREIVSQIIPALRAMHRMGMVHRDIKPENIMMTHSDDIKIIDFGTVQVAGMDDIDSPIAEDHAVGSVNYSAAEYVLGQPATTQSDLFSLALITYEMLTGQRPYSDKSQALRKPMSYSAWHYTPARNVRSDIPAWVDAALERACKPNPENRYAVMSAFFEDISRPNTALPNRENSPALLQRNPLAFWKGLALISLTTATILFFLLMQSRL